MTTTPAPTRPGDRPPEPRRHDLHAVLVHAAGRINAATRGYTIAAAVLAGIDSLPHVVADDAYAAEVFSAAIAAYERAAGAGARVIDRSPAVERIRDHERMLRAADNCTK